ncbi:MAG: hypothetical protein P1P84_02775 [Deferrisomatales bacterium]|nr:hypothetical protein [Deferrisomatales bacterium]
MSYYMGIDPGAGGAVAVVGEDGDAYTWDYPGDAVAVGQLLVEILSAHMVSSVAIERVHSMPGQGVSSSFKFGQNFGSWLGALGALGIPVITVSPKKWQNEMLDAGTGDTKERSLSMARRLFPNVTLHRKKDNGRADALHLARYARLAQKTGKV